MSKRKNVSGKVPETEIKAPTTIKLTKTQRELFVTKRNQFNEDMKAMIDLFNKPTSEILGKLVDNFIEELKINVIDENWSFSADTLQFTKTEKK